MFHGRQKQLEKMEALWQKGSFQLFVLYGRRRVGKTSLIKEFCKGKEVIFYSAEISNDKVNLDKFSDLVFAHYKESGLEGFASWGNAMMFIHERQKEHPLVLVLDEFPYLAERNASILSTLQHVIDHGLKDGKIFLILCGSYVSFMEREVLGAKSPLFGRRTAQLCLKPFDYREAKAFLSGFQPVEQCQFYGALGGIPQYLCLVDAKKDFRENMVALFLNNMGYLYEEPMFLLREELQQPGVYSAILEAIARGASKANEIAGKTGETAAKCLKYIHVLCGLGIVRKETPYGEKESSRRTIYRMGDNMFRFWYRYVVPNRTFLENDAWIIPWARQIEPGLNDYMGTVFEEICKDFLLRQNSLGELPFLFTSIGRWWGNNPKTKSQEEIDLIAEGEGHILFAECKWRNERTGIKAFSDLQRKSEVFGNRGKEAWFALFSKSGFTESLQEKKRENRLLLFDLRAVMK